MDILPTTHRVALLLHLWDNIQEQSLKCETPGDNHSLPTGDPALTSSHEPPPAFQPAHDHHLGEQNCFQQPCV